MARQKGTPKTGGRQKGTPNKIPRDIRTAVLRAFEAGGGEAWLRQQMSENPVAFMSLLGKILPSQPAVTEQVTINRIERVIVSPAAPVDPYLIEARPVKIS